MTTVIYILGLSITILISSSSNGNLVVPSHPALLQHANPASPVLRHNHKLAAAVNHVGHKSLSKGLHTRIPVLPRVPLPVPSIGAKLKPHLVHSKALTSPISAVSHLSQLSIRSVEKNNNTAKSRDLQTNGMKNASNAKIGQSILSNTSGINSVYSSKNKSTDLNEIIDELDYLGKAANPDDVSESNIVITTQNNEGEFKYRLQKANATSWSNFSQNLTKIPDDRANLVPYKISLQDSRNNNYESESITTSAGNRMSDYLRVMNVSRNFQNPSAYQSNQSKPLTNVLSDFQKSLTQSLLWQNGQSSFQQNNNNQTVINYNDNFYEHKYQQNSNAADRLWNTANNVTEKASDITGNFKNTASDPENIENNQLPKMFKNESEYPLEDRYRSSPQTGYPPAHPAPIISQNAYPLEHQLQSSPQIGLPNTATDMADTNAQLNIAYYNNRQSTSQPAYNGGYYQENNPPPPVWNPAVNLGQNIVRLDPGTYYYKKSNPIEILLNPTNQYLISRRYRQMPARNYDEGATLGQTSSVDNQELNSASSIINSALNLAESIVGGDYRKIIRSSINMGKDISYAANRLNSPQYFKRNVPDENISNSPITVPDGMDPLKLNNKENSEIFRSTNRLPDINSNLVDTNDTLSINSRSSGEDAILSSNNYEYDRESIPTESIENSGRVLITKNTANNDNDETLGSENPLNMNPNLASDLASKKDRIRMSPGLYETEPIWRLATPLTDIANAAIHPRLLGVRRILRGPYGSGTYLSIIPLRRTLYKPADQIADLSKTPKGHAQLGTTISYL